MALLGAHKLLFVGNNAVNVNPPSYKNWLASGTFQQVTSFSTFWSKLVAPCTYFSGEVDSASVLMTADFVPFIYRSMTPFSSTFTGYTFKPDFASNDVQITFETNVTSYLYSAGMGTGRMTDDVSAGFPRVFYSASSSGYTGSPSTAFSEDSSLSATNIVTASSTIQSANTTYGMRSVSGSWSVSYSARSATFNKSAFVGNSSFAYPQRDPAWMRISAMAKCDNTAQLVWSASGRVLV